MPAPPVRVSSKQDDPHQEHTGGTPMGTPPSARGIAAELPFVDGNREGRSTGHSPASHTTLVTAKVPQLTGHCSLCNLELGHDTAGFAFTVVTISAGLLCFLLTSMLCCTCLVGQYTPLPGQVSTIPLPGHVSSIPLLGQAKAVPLLGQASDTPLLIKADLQEHLEHQNLQGPPSLAAPCPAMLQALPSMLGAMWSSSGSSSFTSSQALTALKALAGKSRREAPLQVSMLLCLIVLQGHGLQFFVGRLFSNDSIRLHSG